ncbi:MAG: hypothetical protein U1E13_00245 [Methylophilaceae bacterium]|nr:hypothetical protein [Methylophilaceae bacterium]
MEKDALSVLELKYLRIIDKGQFEHRAFLPLEVSQLIAKGLVEVVTKMGFPLPAVQYQYRPTVYGRYLLSQLSSSDD